MIEKANQCIHYAVSLNQGNYVDCKVDGIFFGLCVKCFRRLYHKKGVEIIRYVTNGVKFTPPANVPF